MKHRKLVIYHAKGTPTISEDFYDYIFDNGKVGDWWWDRTTSPEGKSYRVLRIVVPSLRGEGQGPLESRGAELITVFPSHAENDWSKPGNDNGWDGAEAEPTLSPSIFVGGNSDNPGWHGFFSKGKLTNT